MPQYLTDVPDITYDLVEIRRRVGVLENKSIGGQQITSTSAVTAPPPGTTSTIPAGSITYDRLAPDVTTTFDGRYIRKTGDTMTGALAVNAPLTVGISGTPQSLIVTGTSSTTGTGNVDGVFTVGSASLLKGGAQLGTRGISGQPALDFHSSISSTNYDARLITSGGNTADGGGSLQIIAAGLQLPIVTAPLTIANTLTVSGVYATNLGGDLTVSGAANFNGAFNLAGGLSVAGVTNLNGGLGNSVTGQNDNTFFAWDAGSRRIGFSKKLGQYGKIAYANATFAITQYVGQTSIDPLNPQTDRLTIDPSGNVGISVGLTSGTLAVTGFSTFSGAAALNGGVSTKDILTGGAGIGIGNLAGQTVDTYNIKDQAITAAKLSPGALAASSTPSGTANNGRAKLLRYVTANPATKDSAGQNLDNLLTTTDLGVSRVIDSQAYGGNAILVQAAAYIAASGTIFQYGPYYGSDASDYVGSPGFAPGQYRVTVYAKVTSTASALPIVGFEAHCQTAGVVLNDGTQYVFRNSELNTYYVGCSFPLYLQADTRNTAGLEIRSHYYTAAGADLRISHIQIEPYSGLSQGEVNDTYIKDLSVTNAKIANLQADKITTGTLTADITQSGVIRTGPTSGARVELNSGGLYAYSSATAITAQILSNGQVTITGTINATGGAFSGVVTGGTFRGGTFETAAGYVSAVRLDTTGLHAYDAGGINTFSVATDGTLTATKANISGTVNALNGSFGGELYGNGISGARISTSRSLATRNPEGANGTTDWTDIDNGLPAVVTQQTGGPVGSGYAIQFAYGTTTAPISPPTATTAVPSTTGGTLATATYYYVVTATTAAGETLRSDELPAAVVGPTGSVAVSWTAPAGPVLTYRVYRGAATGAESVFVGSVAAGTLSLTDIGATATGYPPNANQSGNLRSYAVMSDYLFSSPGVVKAGDQVTLSFYAEVLSGDPNVRVGILHGDGTQAMMPTQPLVLTNTFTRYTYTFLSGVDSDTTHRLYIPKVDLQNAATFQITGVQIEFGPAATAYGSGQQRIELTSLGLKAYDITGTQVTFIDASTGILHATGVDLTGTHTGIINATGGVFSGNITANSLTLTGGKFVSTNIDATNLIQGGAIVAGTLTAGSLSIASSFGDSAILNGGFEDETNPGSAVPSNWTPAYETSGAAGSFQRTTTNPYAGSARGSISVAINNGSAIASSSIPVTPGDTWQVKGDLRGEGQAGPFYVRVLFGTTKDFARSATVTAIPTGTVYTGIGGFNGGGNNGFYDIVSGQSVPAQNAWYPVEATVTVPAGATWMRLALYTWTNSASGWTGNFDGWVVRQQLTSTSIADGTITTNKISANGIDGKVITAGTLTADKIGTGTLDATTTVTVGGPVGSAAAIVIDGRPTSAGLRLITGANATVVALDAVTGGATFTGRINASSGTFTGTIDNTAGTFMGGIITGAVIQTATSGTRTILTPAQQGLVFYNGSATTPATVTTFASSVGYTGISIQAGDPTNGPTIQMDHGLAVFSGGKGNSLYINYDTGYTQLNTTADIRINGLTVGIKDTLWNSNGVSFPGNVAVGGKLTAASFALGSEIDFKLSGSPYTYDARIFASGAQGNATIQYEGAQHNFRVSNATISIINGNGDYQAYAAVYANNGFFDQYGYDASYGFKTTRAIYAAGSINGSGGIYDNGNRVYSASNPPPSGSVDFTNQNISGSYINNGFLYIRSGTDYNHLLAYNLAGRDGPDLRGYAHVGFQVVTYSSNVSAMRIDGSANLYVGGTGNFSQSTINVKRDITSPPAGHGLAVLQRLLPKWYKRKDRQDDEVHFGFIAEEMVEHTPELVMMEGDAPVAVNYGGLTPYLVHAVQELSALVDSLSAKIATLEMKGA